MALRHKTIHDGLRALVLRGPFYGCLLDNQTGLLAVNETKPIAPAGITVVQMKSEFDARSRRNFSSDRVAWTWVVRVEFPGQMISYEAWEEAVNATNVVLADNLLARLVSSDYNATPESSPNRGAVAEFVFTVFPLSMRT